jgi:hypothetical protein
MNDPSTLTLAELERTYQEFKSQTGNLVKAFVVTPLFNHLDGYWQVPYQGYTYVLIGRVVLARVISVLPTTKVPEIIQAPFETLFGIPIIEDEDLARSLIMTALKMVSTTMQTPGT